MPCGNFSKVKEKMLCKKIMFSLERGSDTINNWTVTPLLCQSTLHSELWKLHKVVCPQNSNCFPWCHRNICSFLSTFKPLISIFSWNFIHAIQLLSCTLVKDIFLKVTCISYTLAKFAYYSFRTTVPMGMSHSCPQHTLITLPPASTAISFSISVPSPFSHGWRWFIAARTQAAS